MHPENERYVLEVSDNGAGLPDGIDVKNTRTLGLKLVSRLTGQMLSELYGVDIALVRHDEEP